MKWVWTLPENPVKEVDDEAIELVVLDEGKAQLLDKEKKNLMDHRMMPIRSD